MNNKKDDSMFLMDDSTLNHLIGRISCDDRNALGELYDITSTSIFGYALSIVCNKTIAEDVMHDVYIQILLKARLYKGQGKAMAWILRITRNIAYNMIRRQKYDLLISYDGLTGSLIQNSNEEEILDRIILKEVLTKLPITERQVIVLYLFVGVTQYEISRIMSSPLTTVKWRYKNGLKKLSKIIQKIDKEIDNEKS